MLYDEKKMVGPTATRMVLRFCMTTANGERLSGV